jgi:hypothetical protein
LPDRVDLHESPEQEEHRGDREQQTKGTRRLPREAGHAEQCSLRLAERPSELRVVAQRDEPEVRGEQDGDEHRQQEHVRDVHPRFEVGRAGVRALPKELGEIGADEGDRQGHRVADRQPHAREQVTTTGHAASARSGERAVPGICGIPRGPRDNQPLIRHAGVVDRYPGTVVV